MDPGVTHKQDSEVKGHDGMGEGTVLGKDDKESEDMHWKVHGARTAL